MRKLGLFAVVGLLGLCAVLLTGCFLSFGRGTNEPPPAPHPHDGAWTRIMPSGFRDDIEIKNGIVLTEGNSTRCMLATINFSS